MPYSDLDILKSFLQDTSTKPDTFTLNVRKYFTEIPMDDAGGKFLQASKSERERMRAVMVPTVKPSEASKAVFRPRHCPLSEQDARDIKALSRTYSTRQLGKKYGVSHYTIWRIIQKVPLWHPAKPLKVTGERLEALRKDFESGMKRKEIARKYCVSPSTVYLLARA